MESFIAGVNMLKKIIMGLSGIIFIMMSLSACEKKQMSNVVFCNKDEYSTYSTVVKKVLPSFLVEKVENKPFYYLDKDGIAEAFDVQAFAAIEVGIGKYWYPHYLATVIIGVDRDQTDVKIAGWNDLISSKQEVSFFDTPGNIQMITAAMAYGLEGSEFSMKETIKLLTSLHENKCLRLNTWDSPILICYDYQAQALKDSGRNIELVIPKEGTFTYAKGLISKEPITFKGDVNQLLVEAKLPISSDGKNNSMAIRVEDSKHFSKTVQNVTALISRKVFNSKNMMSIDNREHLHVALFYIILVTIWMGTFMRRSIQKGIGYAALSTGIILNSWTLVRLIKYQNELSPILTRYLWYAFYIFELYLPLVLLWMAWAIDKPKNKIVPPKWWRNLAVLVNLLIIFVFTNDLHGCVLKLNLSKQDWGINYSYGFGYYIILFVCVANMIGMFSVLLYKSMKNVRKKRFIFPFSVLVLFSLYSYGYITRVKIIYETDITIVTGLFVILLFEACIRAGLIPVNTKYAKLFSQSPLKMQILSNEGKTILASVSAKPITKNLFAMAIARAPEPILQEDDSLLFITQIQGGYVICQEDVSKLNQLVKDMRKSARMLTEANNMLAKEEKIKREINEKKIKKQLTEQLEGEIAEKIKNLSLMIEKLPFVVNPKMETTRIALMLSYIKGRCNLFFKEKEINFMLSNELVIFLDEIAEIGKYAKVQIATVNEISGSIRVRYATLFYDLFYKMIDLVVSLEYNYIIIYLEQGKNEVVMRLLPSKDIGVFEIGDRLEEAIALENGEVRIKEVEETMGISISFPKGGDKYD